MIPTETAATDPVSGSPFRAFRPLRCAHASYSATYAPVIAAVRVPPSACRTSQSRTIEFSPSALRSMQARRLRPISREISWVRPPTLPLTLSRSPRVLVARGSIAYSAVTQPRPDPLRHLGTPSVTLAVHSTRVLPNSTSTDPSGWMLHRRVRVTGRSWSGSRPSGRAIPTPYADPPWRTGKGSGRGSWPAPRLRSARSAHARGRGNGRSQGGDRLVVAGDRHPGPGARRGTGRRPRQALGT